MCADLKCYNDVVGNATKIWALHKISKNMLKKLYLKLAKGNLMTEAA
jgi:hypothetical protein